jgi:lysyl-tRNA synthetase class 2
MPSQTPLEEHAARLRRLEEIKKGGINPYPSKPSKPATHTCEQAVVLYKKLEKKTITLQGRIRSLRLHGGSCFGNIEDDSGKIQIYFRKNEVGKDSYQNLKDLIDVGDFLSVTGALFTTHKGEKTLLVKEWELLTKSLLPLPEKFHGLTDSELRYRKRYLDLIANPQVKTIFKTRSLIIKHIRDFFEEKGYLEIETPVLQPIYGGGLARPFKTHLNALNIDLYLRISPELYLKRLIVGGFEKIFEFSKDFRNEGIDHSHNPEFTLFEAMTAYADYKDSMDLIEEVHEYVANKIIGKLEIDYNGQKINLKRPWKRMTMAQAVKKETKVDMLAIKDTKAAKKEAANLKIEKEKIDEAKSAGEILALIFEEKVEKTLIQPTIIYNYPTETSPLAKKCPDDPRFVERFEHFILGSEGGNHYSELNDPVDLKKRFIEEEKKLREGLDEAHQTDIDFLEAMQHGMPPTSGIGIGIDRLVMLFTGAKTIKEVIAFPMMRPKQEKS